MRTFAIVVALIVTALPVALAQRADCKETRTPGRLPQVSALIDSAAALTGLAGIDAPDGMLFSLIFHEGDSLPRVRPMFGTDPGAAAALVRWIRPQKRGPLWALRIRVAQGPPASLQLERALYCPPVMIPASQPRGRIVARVQPTDQPRTNALGVGAIEIEAKIAEDGIPISVNLVRASGVAEIDDDLVHRWLQTRFHPALIDGVRVEGWYRPAGKSPRL